jgi:hypothetical protein
VRAGMLERIPLTGADAGLRPLRPRIGILHAGR